MKKRLHTYFYESYQVGNVIFENGSKDGLPTTEVNTKDAADLLRISEKALRSLVHGGQIKVKRIGNRMRFRLVDCFKLLDEIEGETKCPSTNT